MARTLIEALEKDEYWDVPLTQYPAWVIAGDAVTDGTRIRYVTKAVQFNNRAEVDAYIQEVGHG